LVVEGHDTTAFFIVMMLAIIKDGLLDPVLTFLGIGVIPILGDMPGLFVTGILFYIMHGKGMLRGKMFRRVLIFFLAGLIPLVKLLPETIFAALFAWNGVKKRAEQAEQDLQVLAQKTDEELESIEQSYEL
jgi:hypothetical protein